MKNQLQKSETKEDFVNVEGVLKNEIIYSTNSLGFLGHSGEDLAKTANVLGSYKKELVRIYKATQAELEEVTKEIEEAFSDLVKDPYYLHAIFVHQGSQADQGHYYAFIHDKKENVWWRFNDFKVTKETEE